MFHSFQLLMLSPAEHSPTTSSPIQPVSNGEFRSQAGRRTRRRHSSLSSIPEDVSFQPKIREGSVTSTSTFFDVSIPELNTTIHLGLNGSKENALDKLERLENIINPDSSIAGINPLSSKANMANIKKT